MTSPEMRRTDCAEVLLRLYEFLDGETAADDHARIQSHLDECGPCLAEYDRDILVKALLQRSCQCQSAPPTLRASILTSLTYTRIEFEERF